MIELMTCCAIFGAFIMFALIKGVEIGQKAINNEKIEVKNPITMIKDHQEASKASKEAEREASEIETMLYNIDAYDGTSIGQKNL